MTDRFETKYEEKPLAAVLDYYIQGFAIPEGARLAGSQTYVDTGSGMCVFKLVIERPAEIGKAMSADSVDEG